MEGIFGGIPTSECYVEVCSHKPAPGIFCGLLCNVQLIYSALLSPSIKLVTIYSNWMSTEINTRNTLHDR